MGDRLNKMAVVTKENYETQNVVNIKSRHTIWEIGLHEYKSTHVGKRFELFYFS